MLELRRTHEFARVHAGNGRRRSRASASIGLACLCKRRRSRRRHAVGLLHPHNTTSCKEKMALIVCMRRRIGRSKEKKSLTERMHFGLIKFYYTGLACPLFTTHPFSNRSVLNGLVPTGAGGSQSPAKESQSPPPQGSGSVTSDSDSTCLPNEWDFDRVLHHIGRGGPFQLTVEQYARDATACLDMQPYRQT